MNTEFELSQIWTSDPKIEPLDEQQRERMGDTFDTYSIPLHVIFDPFDEVELARFTYDPRMTPQDYLDFLDAGLAAFRTAHPDLR